MKCTLIIGDKSPNFRKDERLEFNGRYTYTNLTFSSVKKAKKVAELADVDCYRVMEVKGEWNRFDNHDKPLYETADITAYWKKSAKDAEDYDKDMNRKAKAINKLPKPFSRFFTLCFETFDVKELKLDNGSVLRVYLVRSDYSYNRAHSHNLKGYVSFMVKRDGRVTSDTWWPSDYIKRSGAVMVKKFKDDFYWKFGTNIEEMPKDFDYKNFLVKMRRAQRDLETKLREI